MVRRALLLASAAFALALGLGGCGDGDGGEAGQGGAGQGGAEQAAAGPDGVAEGEGTPLAITAGDIYLEPDEATVPAGPITVTYTNEGQLRHTLLVDGAAPGFYLDVPERGATATGTMQLRPGTYVLYCDIAGHRAAGMEGTLTVE